MTGVIAELKKLVVDDVTVLSELKQVFVDQKVKLIGSPDKGAGHYDAKFNEMTIYTQSAAEMADTIIFESGNARRRAGFQEADKILKEKQPKGLEKVGVAMSDLESGTTLDYFDHVLNMIESGRTYAQLPPGARRQFLFFMQEYPSYFNMDAKRKQQFREAYKMEFRESVHEAKAKPGERMHLTSQDLYAYERVVQRMNISAVLSMVKDYIEKKKGIKLKLDYWSAGKYMSDAQYRPPMIKTTSDVVPDESRGKFYMVLIERAEHYYKVDLGDIKFNAAQIEVAENEHEKTGWNHDNAFQVPGTIWNTLTDVIHGDDNLHCRMPHTLGAVARCGCRFEP